MHGDSTSTANRIYRRLEKAQFDFDKPPDEDEDNDQAPEAASAPLMETVEVPEAL